MVDVDRSSRRKRARARAVGETLGCTHILKWSFNNASPGQITVDPDAIGASDRAPLPAFLPRAVKVARDRMEGLPPAHVRVIGSAIEERDRDYIARKLGMKLGKFAASVERVTVRLSDVNGPKGGVDQKCQVKVVLSGIPSVVVHETDSTLPRTIDRAIESAAVAVRRRIQRRRLKPLHHRARTSL